MVRLHCWTVQGGRVEGELRERCRDVYVDWGPPRSCDLGLIAALSCEIEGWSPIGMLTGQAGLLPGICGGGEMV